MKPPISYYGGKQRMARHIIGLIPPHTAYVEPFAGGGAVFFAKPPSKIEVLNDLNGNLVNFYRVLKTETDSLYAMIDATLYAVSEHTRACEIYRGTVDADPITKAWATFVVCNWSFANRPDGTGGFARSLKRGSSSHIVTASKLKDFHNSAERLKNAVIENSDALEVIKKWDSPGTLFYCDPPYVGAEQRYLNKFTQSQLDCLCDVLNNIEGSFILSGFHENAASTGWNSVDFSVNSGVCNGINGARNSRKREHLWFKGPLFNANTTQISLGAMGVAR